LFTLPFPVGDFFLKGKLDMLPSRKDLKEKWGWEKAKDDITISK
jgi:hypothetical protein